MTADMPKQVHEGRNIKRIREMLGIKQEALAADLGEDWNQKKISLLEGKETIEPPILEEVAKALKVPVEAIKNFDEEGALNIISTTFNSHDNSTSVAYKSTFNFDPIDKIIELYEEQKKLYERMINDKDLMIESLKSLLNREK